MPEDGPFSSSERRTILEREFLLAGIKIRNWCQNPSRKMRPLGFAHLDCLGFGSLFVSYRNCPNNCPLAMWWGNPHGLGFEAIDRWYPLFPRKMNGDDNHLNGWGLSTFFEE
ncbi:MAG: hypothetical protein ACLFWL_09090 [Candidatus Brocadiia bacterium]